MSNQKDNSGVLFKNENKTEDKHPDYKGSATINGVEYWRSAWVNSKDGKTWLSDLYTPKEAKQGQSTQSTSSDLPF